MPTACWRRKVIMRKWLCSDGLGFEVLAMSLPDRLALTRGADHAPLIVEREL
jgi:hypothetical protein